MLHNSLHMDQHAYSFAFAISNNSSSSDQEAPYKYLDDSYSVEHSICKGNFYVVVTEIHSSPPNFLFSDQWRNR